MSDVKKIYVLDTNVLLSDPDAIWEFAEHHVVLPLIVIEEIDRHKSRQDEVGKNARQTSRNLDSLRAEAALEGKSLHEGVDLPPGTFRVAGVKETTFASMPFELRNATIADNVIIATAFCIKNEIVDSDVILVSNDQNVRIKCDSIGLASEQYLRQRVTNNIDELYRGVKTIYGNDNDVNQFYTGNKINLSIADAAAKNIHPNEFVIIKTAEGASAAAIGRYHGDDECIRPMAGVKDAFGLTAKNKEQQFAFDLLFDDKIKLVTLVGPSGTGKTLLATAAGLQQTMGPSAKYERLIITRPVQPVGKDIGFLPGTKEEKMEPWIAPIRDNLSFLFGQGKGKKRRTKADTADNSFLALLMEEGKIEVEAITFIRGRSIPNSFIIIDEAQNLSMHELKTIVTRVGDNTKIVLTGDIDQIDNTHVDAYTNGLTCAVEKFKNYSIAGHVAMIKGERSALATLATQIL